MRKPLALSAYLALNPGQPSAGAAPPWPPRPEGPLVWVHCEDPQRLSAAAALAALLTEEGDQITLVVTTRAPDRHPGILTQPIPEDTQTGARAFLDHWRPDFLLWMEGPLLPALISLSADRDIPRLVLDVSETQPDMPPRTRVPGLARAVLGQFARAMSIDSAGTARLRRAGLSEAQIRLVRPFDPGPQVPACHEAERAELAAALASRPVWLAAAVPTSEVVQLLTAYRLASQRRHRLLMVLACEDEVGAADILNQSGYVVCRYSEGDFPVDATQVILADTGSLGLWYRLAPLTYVGGTLKGGQTIDPFDPAALGSVVIHGLKTTAFRHRFEQLADAAACRMVQSETELGRVVEGLLSPDKAARMAHAAWDVTSRGAETGALVAEILRETFDRAGH